MDLTLLHDDVNREYVLHIPTIYDETAPVPLVIALHGLTNSGPILMETSRFEEIADTANFIVAFPTALTNGLGLTAWNNGLLAGSGADDEGFLTALIDSISTDYSINADRVYFTGFSMGGFMSNYMACNFSDRIAAIASVSGTISSNVLPECSPERPMPMMHMHGTSDNVVGYDGNFVAGMISVDETIDFWREFNQCSNEATLISLPDVADDGITIDKLEVNDCADGTEVWLYEIFNHGHSWLQPENDVWASEEIWHFFQRHELPGATTDVLNIQDNKLELSLYPNPAQRYIILKSTTTLTQKRAIIANALGQQIWQGEIQNPVLDISMLDRGMYFLNVEGTVLSFYKQ